ncbi:hypothetical protein EVAR_62730_1 [Eumeta japonica]|uniref:Uncharacterized protein n=1 Tax=Eumeta variegata TaxID=151549 RepID=A0A4C1ZF07_EUMVA|nr:hypothetical protein EVAR_62730_1 [Eumeta japonica]
MRATRVHTPPALPTCYKGIGYLREERVGWRRVEGADGGGVYHRNSHSLNETKERKLLLHSCCVLPAPACRLSLLLRRIGRWSGREIDASQAERLNRSCLSITCFVLSLVRSA